jgi:hypothetical protein
LEEMLNEGVLNYEGNENRNKSSWYRSKRVPSRANFITKSLQLIIAVAQQRQQQGTWERMLNVGILNYE